MGSIHKSLLLHTEVRVAMFLDEKSDYAESLREEEFVLQIMYLGRHLFEIKRTESVLTRNGKSRYICSPLQNSSFIKRLVEEHLRPQVWLFWNIWNLYYRKWGKTSSWQSLRDVRTFESVERKFWLLLSWREGKLSAKELNCGPVSKRHDDWDIDKGRRRIRRSVRRHLVKNTFQPQKNWHSSGSLFNKSIQLFLLKLWRCSSLLHLCTSVKLDFRWW
jgi:hypothetical protein